MADKVKRPFYLKIKGKAHSRAIQKRLFELGIKWKKGYRVSVRHTNQSYLYISRKGYINARYTKTMGSTFIEYQILDLYTPQILNGLGL